jgi:hypothetical protein
MKVAAAPRAVREIAWKAQSGRFRSLTRKGKRPTVVATAIARELAAFIWVINREVMAHATGELIHRGHGPRSSYEGLDRPTTPPPSHVATG